MAYICYQCGKGVIKGRQHRHKPGVAGRQHLRRVTHTLKKFKPNLHYAYLIEGKQAKRVLLCSKCRRLLKKKGKIKSWQKIQTKKTTAIVPASKNLPETEKASQKVSVEELVGKKQ